MNQNPATQDEAAAGPEVDPAVLADLRLRLRGSQAQERAARAEVRRLACELALTRRLLKFAFDGPPPARAVEAAPIEQIPAFLLTAAMIYHLDTCENRGDHIAVSGWAFCPINGWDATVAAVTLRLHHGDTTYAVPASQVPRPDIAAHYAVLPPESYGAARGLEGSGFACEIPGDSLPAGIDLKIILRLECEGRSCEQFTGQQLRL